MPTSVQSSSYSSDGQLQPQSSTREYPSIPNEADYALPAFEDDDLNGGEPIADYTEGAGEAEIREAIVIRGARKRADSMSGWQGEDDGTSGGRGRLRMRKAKPSVPRLLFFSTSTLLPTCPS